MSVLGKVAGTMLKDNLVRNGVDLVVDGNLMYFDVSNRRVGINTTLPGNTLTVNGSATINTLYANNFYFGNGTPFTSGSGGSSTYSNSNVASYLAAGIDSTILAINANISSANSVISSHTTSINTINANVIAANGVISGHTTSISTINGNITAANLSISTLQSNVGAYESFANIWLGNLQTNVSTINSNITAANSVISSQTTSINSINANIVAANLSISTLQSQVYSNSNVAAYLPTYTGNILAGNISVFGNLTVTGNITSVNYETITQTEYANNIVLTGNLKAGNLNAVTAVYSNNYYYANGVAFTSGGSSNYGNTQVAAYLSASGISGTVVTSDQFTGDGSTATFTLSQSTTTAGAVIMVNGLVQIPTVSYTVSGNQLTLSEAPTSTDIIDARTIVAAASASNYGNANVASYLPTYAGNLTAGNAYITNNVGVGTTSPSSKLTVAGVVESTSGGFKFPDGTTQTTKATSSNGTVTSIATGTGLTGGTITTSGTISLVTTAGAVGTYAFLAITTTPSSVSPGTTVAGSNLSWAGLNESYTNNPYNCSTITHADINNSGSPSGTWQSMGYAISYTYGLATLFVRIA